MKGRIKLLDCTLRDGAHLNQGNFGKKTIRETIQGLVQANVDIIEVGFFDNGEHNEDSTFFSSIADVKKCLPVQKGTSSFALMADYVDVRSVEPCDGSVAFFRLSFKRHRLQWGLNAARILMEKGYKCYINPVNYNVYSEEEYIRVIEQVNQLHPYGFSIVDTFGVMRKEELTRVYSLVEERLDKDITIGLHLHENLGMALLLAQHFLEIRDPERNVSIDASLLGMGRIPGNACTEQLMDHLNYTFGADYNTEPALDVIDDYYIALKKEYGWGYSIPYALSGKYGLHRTYAEYLMGKHRLRTKDIQRILSQVDRDHIEMFDKDYIETLYRRYVDVKYDDTEMIRCLDQELTGKEVLIICPGRSIIGKKEEISALASRKDVLTISVNFVPDFLDPDIVFCANAKRIQNVSSCANTKLLITSNLIPFMETGYNMVIEFNECVYFNEVFCEDSTLMLLKTILRTNCRNVMIAGFDGFRNKGEDYYEPKYTGEVGTPVSMDTVKHILKTTLGEISILFLTESMYN